MLPLGNGDDDGVSVERAYNIAALDNDPSLMEKMSAPSADFMLKVVPSYEPDEDLPYVAAGKAYAMDPTLREHVMHGKRVIKL